MMKNARYLKKLGLYTEDIICIGRKYLSDIPSGTPPCSWMTYFQPSTNNIIMVHASGDYEINNFNSEYMYRYYKISKIDDLTFKMTCYCMNDHIQLFKEKIKCHGISNFRARWAGMKADDFGSYTFKFYNLEDSAVFQVYFSDFLT